MGERIPILYLAPWVDLGGSDKGTIDWFRHLDRERFAPSLITTQPSDNRWLHRVEPYAEEIWDLPDLIPGHSFPGFILSFIEDRGIRIVHMMNSRLGFDLMPDMTNLHEPPVIVVQHHAEEPDRSGYVRYVSTRYGNLVDAFSVTSHQLRDAMTDFDIAPSRVEVIHSGVDAGDEFDPEHVAPFEGLGEGPHILWPGRLVEQKDPELTLEVIAQLHHRGQPFTLHIVGDGHLKPALERRAAQLGIADAIRWHPPSLEMARWYRSCDLLLMTSVFEGVPYVIYEALAMCVPVVAPALPGNREFMDADSGVLVEPRDDVEQYVDALEHLLPDADERARMGRSSRGRMLRDFSLREMAARHHALYDRLLARRPASSVARRDQPHMDEGAVRGLDQPAPAPITLPRSTPPERSVGVLVPCYRHGLYLADCLDSIRAQTLPAAQVVVVDDGSDDPETRTALDEAERDGFARVIRMPQNRGPSAARNRGLRELTTNYVLPLDADDLLLPDALERMVTQLESARPDVGFVYPNVRHFGNRHDYVPSPAYSLFLLLLGNYCPAASLFDRRIFEGGVEYAEDLVLGHEDWDLVLQLGERGIVGEVADGPTFLYRRRGFSRVNAVEYGPEAFSDIIKARHPRLYGSRGAMKVHTAPALSILAMEEAGGPRWEDERLAGLASQTCQDFELLHPAGVSAPEIPECSVIEQQGSQEQWLATALHRARGRWVLVAYPETAELLAQRIFVEQLLLAFVSTQQLDAIAIGSIDGEPTMPMRRLDPPARDIATLRGVAWARSPWGSAMPAELGVTDSLLEDLLLALQATGNVIWRRLQGPAATMQPSTPTGAVVVEAGA